jgi:hypothetical protein
MSDVRKSSVLKKKLHLDFLLSFKFLLRRDEADKREQRSIAQVSEFNISIYLIEKLMNIFCMGMLHVNITIARNLKEMCDF